MKPVYTAFVNGLRAFFRDTGAVNNFIFLTVAYVFGVGVSALFFGRGRQSRPASGSRSAQTGSAGKGNAISGEPESRLPDGQFPSFPSYWEPAETGNRESDAYYRPF